MKTGIFTILIVFFAVILSTAQKEDKKKTTTIVQAEPTEGVVYALPQTGLRVFVKATRVRYTKGPFSNYAQKLLGIENVPGDNANRWSMDEIRIETFSEPDPAQVRKAMGSDAGLVGLTSSGILAGINSSGIFKAINPKAPIQEKEIQTGSFLLKNSSQEQIFTDLSTLSFYSPADSSQKYKMVSKSMEQKAIEAAETIFRLREARFELLTNANDEPLPDGQSFEVMARELARMEENYVALFIGKSTQQTFDFSFDYIPGNKSVKGEVLFRFSEDRGVLPKSDLSGRPISVELVKAEDLAAKQAALSTSENPNAGKSGIFYRMPGMAEIKISDGATLLAVTRAAIAQFGTVAPVPENLLDGGAQFEFHPGTGSIQSITEMK